MKASDLFVEALEKEGVEYLFGIPGEENLDLLESLRDSSIRLILTRHEQAAGFMAATYGRLTGKAGVCLSTLGPGAAQRHRARGASRLLRRQAERSRGRARGQECGAGARPPEL